MKRNSFKLSFLVNLIFLIFANKFVFSQTEVTFDASPKTSSNGVVFTLSGAASVAYGAYSMNTTLGTPCSATVNISMPIDITQIYLSWATNTQGMSVQFYCGTILKGSVPYSSTGWKSVNMTAIDKMVIYNDGNSNGGAGDLQKCTFKLSVGHKLSYDGNGYTGGTVPGDNNSYREGVGVGILGPGTMMKTGYTFAGWNTLVNGTGTNYMAGNTMIMPADNVTLYAKWVINTYAINYDVETGNGSLSATVDGNPVTSTAIVEYGKNVVFTAAPNPGYKVKQWTVNGTPVSGNTTNNYTLTSVTANATVNVEYELITHSVSFNVAGGSGTLAATVDGSSITSGSAVAEGKNIVFTATPSASYRVKQWILNGTPVSGNTSTSYTLNNLTADATVGIEFETPAINCLSFNGTNQYVEMPGAVIPASGDFTVSVWANYKGLLSGYSEILSQGTSGNAFYLGKDGGIIRCGDGWFNTSVSFPTDNAWHNYTVTKTASNAYLYIDGNLVATKGSAIPNPAVTTFRISRQYGTYSEYFKGSIDEIKVWNRALSACEISASKSNTLTGSEQGLIAYYNFNEGNGALLTDLAGGDNNGTAYNNPVWMISDNTNVTSNLDLAVGTISSVSGITANTATVSGSIITGTPSATGVVYGTTPCPTTPAVIGSSLSGTFTANLTALTPGTTYYARAFASNASGIVYGQEISFTTLSPEINIQGNSANIADGSTITGTSNHTDFGSVTIGYNWVRTYTIHNTGTATLTVGNITISGTNASLFTVGGLTLPANIAAGSSTTFTVTYAPIAKGLHTATVTITNNDADENPYSFTITGLGIPTTATWNGTTWSPSSPSASDNVIIDGNYSGSDFTACNNLTVNPDKQFTLSGTLTVNGNLTLKSDATGTATFIQNGTLTVVGSTNVEQYMTLGRNWYMSSPVSAAKTAVFSPDGTNRKYYVWDEPTFTFTPVTNTTTNIDLTRGHIGRIETSSAVTYTGGVLNNGDYTTGPLSRTGTTDIKRGYHLVGNPYPSFLNLQALYNKGGLDPNTNTTNIKTTFWVKSRINSVYQFLTYNPISDEGTLIIPDPAKPDEKFELNQNIAPMQSFWVRVKADGLTGKLDFDNTMRSHGSNKLLKTENIEKQRVRLYLSNNKCTDEAIVCFITGAESGYENYDSPKMWNEQADIAEIYSIVANEQLVINGLNPQAISQPVLLGIRTATGGNLKIRAGEITNFPMSTTVILEDKLTGTKQNLTEKPEYSFTAVAGTTDNRFVLHFASTTTDVKDVETADDIKITGAEGYIRISTDNAVLQSAEYRITNSVGQVILNGKLSGNETIINNGLLTGVYIVGIRKAGIWNNTKVVVRK